MRKKAVTVLLIDDSPEDRRIYQAYLSEQTDCLYTFLKADDGEEGLRICRQAQVDLILLDFELPDLNGLEVLERLRDEEDGIPVPVVMMTGRGNEEVAVQALKAGALDYLIKSAVTAMSLYRATRNALERAELAAQLRAEKADREEVEDELRESETRFRLLVESVALVHELIELRADQLGAGRNLIQVEATSAVWGSWDRSRLQQVVFGLLLNAVEHAPGQPVAVRIEAHGRMARLSVADRGPGISRADQGRIFERFVRIEAASDGSGLGLGLFIARHVVQAFGGSISVESEPGHGATFTIDLPLGDQLDADASHSRV